MSAIDLIILGILIEKPQSAYDIQKDIEYHNLSKWTKISIPSIYKKVLVLKEKGYLNSKKTTGEKLTEKVIYYITCSGKSYFNELMNLFASKNLSFTLDFNIVVANLNKVDKQDAIDLIYTLKNNIIQSRKINNKYKSKFKDIPLVGRTIFDQQTILYDSMLKWIDQFENDFKEEI